MPLWTVNITLTESIIKFALQCGDKKQGVLAVAGPKSVVNPTPLLLFDGVTEKVTGFWIP